MPRVKGKVEASVWQTCRSCGGKGCPLCDHKGGWDIVLYASPPPTPKPPPREPDGLMAFTMKQTRGMM
jgi:hypothetical protein